jgi:predicted membrane-bound spermidine synthase
MDTHVRPFVPMVELLPEAEIRSATLQHIEITQEQSDFSRIRAAAGNRSEYVPAGQYVRLLIDGSLVMSDTLMEQSSHLSFVYSARGDVLIAGLGIGMCVLAILDKENVDSVTVVEKNEDVIELIGQYIQHEKLTIIHGDIFEWKPDKGVKYDTIWFDIWSDACTDNLTEIARLHQRGKFWKRSTRSFMGSWKQEELRYMKKSGW